MKHIRLIACLSLLIVGASAGSTESETTRFYSTLVFRETPYADLRGAIPLTAREAGQRNHYRFRYDERGRLSEVSFRLGDELRPINHTANYFFPASRVAISYRGGDERRRFFDHHGNPVLVDDAVLEEVYELDGQGRRVALRLLGRERQPVENGWNLHSYRWRHTESRTVVEWRKNLQGKAVDMRPHLAFRIVRFIYRGDGLLDVMQNLDRNGELLENRTGVAQDRLDYRADGTIAGWTVLDAEGRPARGNHPDVSRGRITVDRWGYESEIRYEEESGRAIRNAFGWGRGRTDYDRFGNWRRRAFFDELGQPLVVARLGYHRYVFSWDESGRKLLSRWYENTEGTRVAHAERGFSGVVYDYADGVDPIRIRFVDPRGRPVERIDSGVATIERRYDALGRRLEERFLDADGNLVADGRLGYAGSEYSYDAAGVPLVPRRFGRASE